MGMYTTILGENGFQCQFKTGWDELEYYRVGDEVPWRIIPTAPGEGHILDGIYEGTGWFPNSGEGDDYWVVIQNHTVAACIKRDPELPYDEEWARVNARYPTVPVPRDLWPEEIWEAKAARLRKWEEDREQRAAALRAEDPSLSPRLIAMRLALQEWKSQPPSIPVVTEGAEAERRTKINAKIPPPPEAYEQSQHELRILTGLDTSGWHSQPMTPEINLVDLAKRRFEVVRDVVDPADACRMVEPLRRNLDYTGVARKTFTEEELVEADFDEDADFSPGRPKKEN